MRAYGATDSNTGTQFDSSGVNLTASSLTTGKGWFVGGSINVTTGSGEAELSVPISGPKGDGTIYVTGHKSAGTWSYSQMLAAIKGSSEKIDLLARETAASNSGANTPGPAQPAQTAPEGQEARVARPSLRLFISW